MKKFLYVASAVCALQCCYGAGVTVYKDTNYGGASVKYGVGSHNYNEIRRNDPGDDAISSVKVDPGYRVILFAKLNRFSDKTFFFYLKECEFRFNHRGEDFATNFAGNFRIIL